MKPVPGKTEAEVLEAIERAVATLAPLHIFGHLDLDDLKQYGRLFALQALEKEVYDPSRPLENFLYTHIKNRFLNLKRDKLKRADAPCKTCHHGTFCTGTNAPCERYERWSRRNRAKQQLMNRAAPSEPDESPATSVSTTADVETQEILELIDERLPISLRANYLRLKDGVVLPQEDADAVMGALREILEGTLVF